MREKGRNPVNQLSRECIVAALTQLLQEKTLSEISISELAKRAGVSRMTFYRNYDTKEQVLLEYLREIVEDYRREAASIPGKKGAKYYDMDNLIHCFTYFQKYHAFIQCLFRSNFGDAFRKAIADYVLDTWMGEEGGVERYYTLQAFAGALCNVYVAWALNGTRETPEKIAGILYQIYRKRAGSICTVPEEKNVV